MKPLNKLLLSTGYFYDSTLGVRYYCGVASNEAI